MPLLRCRAVPLHRLHNVLYHTRSGLVAYPQQHLSLGIALLCRPPQQLDRFAEVTLIQTRLCLPDLFLRLRAATRFRIISQPLFRRFIPLRGGQAIPLLCLLRVFIHPKSLSAVLPQQQLCLRQPFLRRSPDVLYRLATIFRHAVAIGIAEPQSVMRLGGSLFHRRAIPPHRLHRIPRCPLALLQALPQQQLCRGVARLSRAAQQLQSPLRFLLAPLTHQQLPPESIFLLLRGKQQPCRLATALRAQSHHQPAEQQPRKPYSPSGKHHSFLPAPSLFHRLCFHEFSFFELSQ